MIIIWSWKNSIYGEQNWSLAEAKYAGDTLLCRDRKVSVENLEMIIDLVKEYQTKGPVMVFLHRFHGYEQQQIEQISQQTVNGSNEVFCFLFGEGSEPVYLTQNPRGLLGISGTFSAKMAINGHSPSSISAIADESKKELKSAHFNYVWELYQFELYNRSFELKEDLFRALQEVLPRTLLEQGEAYQIISSNKHRGIFLRLLNFAGKMRKNSNLAQELRSLEQQLGRRLSFDDCNTQLQQHYDLKTREAYQDLSKIIIQRLLGKTGATDLKEIRAKFNLLLSLVIDKPSHT